MSKQNLTADASDGPIISGATDFKRMLAALAQVPKAEIDALEAARARRPKGPPKDKKSAG